jgi:hypothetical protein
MHAAPRNVVPGVARGRAAGLLVTSLLAASVLLGGCAGNRANETGTQAAAPGTGAPAGTTTDRGSRLLGPRAPLGALSSETPPVPDLPGVPVAPAPEPTAGDPAAFVPPPPPALPPPASPAPEAPAVPDLPPAPASDRAAAAPAGPLRESSDLPPPPEVRRREP